MPKTNRKEFFIVGNIVLLDVAKDRMFRPKKKQSFPKPELKIQRVPQRQKICGNSSVQAPNFNRWGRSAGWGL